jgi:hypothetical protein
MEQTTPNLIPLGVLTMVAMVLLVAAVTRLMLARQRAAQRVVEKPNSEYVWERVQQIEKANRWAAIKLEALHEINQDEVRRLLARVEASGPDSLRPMERAFLDSLAGTMTRRFNKCWMQRSTAAPRTRRIGACDCWRRIRTCRAISCIASGKHSV